MSIVLECKETRDFIPHPEGIHPAVCVDVIDLGLVDTEFQGQRRRVNKVKLVFETEQRMDDGRPFTVSKSFTASLHPKARLAEFIGKWRGRPLVPGEFFDLGKLVGACCTLVTSLQQNAFGRTYASIDAVSKPTRKVVPSGSYDPAAARQRYEEWKARRLGSAERGAWSPEQGGGNAGSPSTGDRDQRSEIRGQVSARSNAPLTASQGARPVPQPSPALRTPAPTPVGEGPAAQPVAEDDVPF